MHKLLEEHPDNFPGLKQIQHDWTLECVIDEEWKMKISSIESEKTRKIVENVVDQFKRFLADCPDLPTGIVHGDLNSLNIIGQVQEDNQSVVMKAIIDFGDVCKSAFVFDLGI